MLLRRAGNVSRPLCQCWTATCSYRSGETLKDKVKMDMSTPPTGTSECDWIGPPDPDSNVRPIRFHIPENESRNEKALRLLREETQAWNHEFWAKHNKEFVQQKDDFIHAKLKELGRRKSDGSKRRLTPEQISEYYKMSLDKKYEIHKEYNREWYRRNMYLLWPALKVNIGRLLKSWER